MKFNHRIFTVFSICATMFFLTFFFLQYSSKEDNENTQIKSTKKPYASQAKADEKNVENQTVDNSPVPNTPQAEKEEYLLRLEDNYICAYYISATGRRLITSSRAKISAISNDDIERLRSGIYADSYEDICLYFESWSS